MFERCITALAGLFLDGILLLVIVMGGIGCGDGDRSPRVQWSHPILSGFEGSPAYCDLFGDGDLEAVVPVAFPDHPGLSYIEVVHASDGEILWRSEISGPDFANPLCAEVDDDGTLDVISGGRSGDVVALSGRDGSLLWSLQRRYPGRIHANTYTPVAIRAHPDFFFVSTGGGGEGPGREPGSVLVMDKDGVILASWSEPDDAEIYTTPAVVDKGDGTVLIAVGSGGETLPGKLYLLEYDTVSAGFSVLATQRSSCELGGFISSPSIGDVTGDGRPDVVATDWCGSIVALSIDGREEWTRALDRPYATSNPLLADLDGDGVLDVITAGGGLNWSVPETIAIRDSIVTALRGIDGVPIWEVAVKKQISSSLVSADLDRDGTEDIWVIGLDFDAQGGDPPPSQLLVLSGASGETLFTYQNVSWTGTPVLDDADGNGSLDALLVNAPFALPTFPALPSDLLLLDFPGIPFKASRSYSGFRGAGHDGFRARQP